MPECPLPRPLLNWMMASAVKILSAKEFIACGHNFYWQLDLGTPRNFAEKNSLCRPRVVCGHLDDPFRLAQAGGYTPSSPFLSHPEGHMASKSLLQFVKPRGVPSRSGEPVSSYTANAGVHKDSNEDAGLIDSTSVAVSSCLRDSHSAGVIVAGPAMATLHLISMTYADSLE